MIDEGKLAVGGPTHPGLCGSFLVGTLQVPYQGNLLLKSKKGRLVALSGHLNLPSTASLWCSPGCLPELISLFSRVACQNEEWQTWPWEEYGSVIRTGLVSAWHPSGLTQRC